jgi:hypothetical protein
MLQRSELAVTPFVRPTPDGNYVAIVIDSVVTRQ